MRTELKILILSFIIIISGIGFAVIIEPYEDETSDDDTTSTPSITNLRPYKGDTINYAFPIIGAYYGDTPDIDVKSVLLKVDSLDVTTMAIVTLWNVTYKPKEALEDGIHLVYLEVANRQGVMEKVVWYFFIDAFAPKTYPLNVGIEVETDRDAYGPNEHVNITVRIINYDMNNIAVLDFDTKHQYNLIIFDSNGTEVFGLFKDFTVHCNPTTINLFPGTEKTLLKKYTWNRANTDGIQVQSGNYSIITNLIGYNISHETKIFIGKHREVYLKIMTNKNAYNIGDNIGITAYLVNEMSVDLKFCVYGTHLDNPVIYSPKREIIYEVQIYHVGIVSCFISHSNNEMKIYSFDWNQTYFNLYRIDDWYHQVPPEIHEISFALQGTSMTDLDWSFILDPWPSDFLGYRVLGFKSIVII